MIQMVDRNTHLKVFISFSAEDRSHADRVKKFLEENFDIECFMAPDDVKASEEWSDTIMTQIRDSDIFIPLLSQNFKNSDWCPQEVGVAYYCKYHVEDFQIIPLGIGGAETFGFLNRIQSNELTDFNLMDPILEKHQEYMVPKMVSALGEIYGYRLAEHVMKLLEPYYNALDDTLVNELIENAIKNEQVNDAGKCKEEYLPKFIEINRRRIDPSNLKNLEDLIAIK